jgi:hypothetical protein
MFVAHIENLIDNMQIILLSWNFLDHDRAIEIIDSLAQHGQPEVAFRLVLKMGKHVKKMPASVLRRLCLALAESDNVETLLLAEKCFVSLQNHHGAETPFLRLEWGDAALVCARSKWLYRINKPSLEMLRLHLGDCMEHMASDKEGLHEVFCHMLNILPSEVIAALDLPIVLNAMHSISYSEI